MIAEKIRLSTSQNTKNIRHSLQALSSSPYSQSLYKTRYSIYKNPSFNSPSHIENSFLKVEKSTIKSSLSNKNIRISSVFETSAYIEKSKNLSLKLAKMLSNKTLNSTYFSIYSEIYSEFTDLFPDFKDLLLSLRKGLVISAIKEKDFDEFDFRKDLEGFDSDLQKQLSKERKEKCKLANKLDNLSAQYFKLKEEHDVALKKVRKYEKIIFPDSENYNQSLKKFEKVIVKKIDILQRQDTWLNTIKKMNLTLKTDQGEEFARDCDENFGENVETKEGD